MDDLQFKALARYRPPQVNWTAHDNYICERIPILQKWQPLFMSEFHDWKMAIYYFNHEPSKPLFLSAFIPAIHFPKRAARLVDRIQVARLGKREIFDSRTVIESKLEELGLIGRIGEGNLPYEIFYEIVPAVSFRKS
jgi:hypothetical protein